VFYWGEKMMITHSSFERYNLRSETEIKQKEPLSLSKSGNCPVCKKNIKHVEKDYTIFKSKPVLIYKDRVETKCPNCSSPLVDKY
jgi:endogenous inhibitor of DNA gyrase (YacG/DUF329 family)